MSLLRRLCGGKHHAVPESFAQEKPTDEEIHLGLKDLALKMSNHPVTRNYRVPADLVQDFYRLRDAAATVGGGGAGEAKYLFWNFVDTWVIPAGLRRPGLKLVSPEGAGRFVCYPEIEVTAPQSVFDELDKKAEQEVVADFLRAAEMATAGPDISDLQPMAIPVTKPACTPCCREPQKEDTVAEGEHEYYDTPRAESSKEGTNWYYRSGGYDKSDGTYGKCGTRALAEWAIAAHKRDLETQAPAEWPTAEQHALDILREVLMDPVLTNCRSFSELHDYCDANMLGGVGELLDNQAQGDIWNDKLTELRNKAQDIVDRLLARDGSASTPDTEKSRRLVIGEHSDGNTEIYEFVSREEPSDDLVERYLKEQANYGEDDMITLWPSHDVVDLDAWVRSYPAP